MDGEYGSVPGIIGVDIGGTFTDIVHYMPPLTMNESGQLNIHKVPSTPKNPVPAASQGTMNNLTLGGYDAERGKAFAYYETMGGGMGARPGADGLSGVHVHMSNTRNTPIEALEMELPVRVRRYALRPGSGGAGRYRGGEGLCRDLVFLAPATVTLLTERRKRAPYGLHGGEAGSVGINMLERDGRVRHLTGKVTFEARVGDVLSMCTPGGGGFLPKEKEN